MPLQTIEPQRLYRQIAEQLRSLITSGEFTTGARLPAERDLSRHLGVSRLSGRDAFIALELESVMQVRTGSRTYFLHPNERVCRHQHAVASSEWGRRRLSR